jgi:hypothetical protein
MRKVAPFVAPNVPALVSKVTELCQASQQCTEEVADAFTVSNYTVQRTLNGSTAVLADVVNVLATFIHDMQQRGSTRTNG